MPEFQKPSEFVLPLSTLAGKGGTPFQQNADLVFINRRYDKTIYKNFEFQSGTLIHKPTDLNEGSASDRLPSMSVPYFSLSSIVLLIFFRNLYFSSFQKYFVSLVNNFEIDFNFQKIGFGPVFLGFLIVFLGLVGFFAEPSFSSENHWSSWFLSLQTPALFLFYPLSISTLILFFLAFSIRIFPLIFSDLKVLFFISLLAVTWRLVDFGAQIDSFITFQFTLQALAALFFGFRSILFYQVLRKAYRFQIGLTLFYICALNLTTFLILFIVLPKETF